MKGKKPLEKEKMSNLVYWGLSYMKKVDWNKVKKVYGFDEVERLKRERAALGVGRRGDPARGNHG